MCAPVAESQPSMNFRYLRDFTYRRTRANSRSQYRLVSQDAGLNAEYLMLKSEIGMYYDASVRDVASPRCPKNTRFSAHVERFAENRRVLEDTFVGAWNKLTRS